MNSRDKVEDAGKRGLAEQFLESFGKAIRSMNVTFRSGLEKNDVTWSQFRLMKVVKFRGPVNVTELSNVMHIAPPTASRMIDSLCEKGMLAKSKDTKDNRITRVRLTGKSRRLLKKIMEMQSEMMVEVFEGKDPEELETLIEQIDGISERWLRLAARKAGVANFDE